jgi:hypothetical protein
MLERVEVAPGIEKTGNAILYNGLGSWGVTGDDWHAEGEGLEYYVRHAFVARREYEDARAAHDLQCLLARKNAVEDKPLLDVEGTAKLAECLESRSGADHLEDDVGEPRKHSNNVIHVLPGHESSNEYHAPRIALD